MSKTKRIIKALLETIVIALVCIVIILFALVLAWVKFHLGVFLYAILFLGFMFIFTYYTSGDDNNDK